MGKAPAFQFYANDFMDATSTWEANACGLYVRCLCKQWTHGSIPADLRILARAIHCDRSELETCWPMLGPKFVDQGDGTLKNSRLEEVRERQSEISSKRSEAGKADMVDARLGPGSLPGFRGTTPVSGGGASTQLQPRLDIMPWEPDYPGGPLPPPGSPPYYGKPGGGMPAPPQFPGSGGIYGGPMGGGMDQSVGSDALGGPSGAPVRGLPPGADIGMGIQESPDQVAPGGGNQAMQDYLSQIQLPKRFQGNIQQAMQFMQQNPQSRLGRGFAAGAPQMGPMNYNPLLGG